MTATNLIFHAHENMCVVLADSPGGHGSLPPGKDVGSRCGNLCFATSLPTPKRTLIPAWVFPFLLTGASVGDGAPCPGKPGGRRSGGPVLQGGRAHHRAHRRAGAIHEKPPGDDAGHSQHSAAASPRRGASGMASNSGRANAWKLPAELARRSPSGRRC